MDRRDFFKKSISVGVFGSAATGIITSAAIAKPEIILPKSLFLGKDVAIEEIKLKLEAAYKTAFQAYKGSANLEEPTEVTELLSQLESLNFVDFIAYESVAARVYGTRIKKGFAPDWYTKSADMFYDLWARVRA